MLVEFNTSSNSSGKCPLVHDQTLSARALRISAYLLLIVISTIGNSLVIYVIKRNSSMRKVTYFFISNLSASDLLVTVLCMPYMISYELVEKKWIFGPVICKLVPFLQTVSVSSSMLTLSAVAFERFEVIVFPHRKLVKNLTAKIAIALIWMASVFIAAPLLYALRVVTVGHNVSICIEFWSAPFDPQTAPKHYTLVLFIAFYVAPLLTMASLYSCICYKLCRQTKAIERENRMRTKKSRLKLKAVKILFTVTVGFLLCWTPYWVRMLLVDYASSIVPCLHSNINLAFVVLFLGHFNSTINPILYSILSVNFRRGFQKAFKRRPSAAQSRGICQAERLNLGLSFQGSLFTNNNRFPLENEKHLCIGLRKRGEISHRQASVVMLRFSKTSEAFNMNAFDKAMFLGTGITVC